MMFNDNTLGKCRLVLYLACGPPPPPTSPRCSAREVRRWVSRSFNSLLLTCETKYILRFVRDHTLHMNFCPHPINHPTLFFLSFFSSIWIMLNLMQPYRCRSNNKNKTNKPILLLNLCRQPGPLLTICLAQGACGSKSWELCISKSGIRLKNINGTLLRTRPNRFPFSKARTWHTQQGPLHKRCRKIYYFVCLIYGVLSMPVQAVTLLLRPFFSREMLVDIPPLAMACAAASRWYVRLHTKPPLSSLVCQLTHKAPSLFSGVPTYTQSPLSLLWCANLHTKTPSLSSLVCQLTHKNPSLSSLVCQLTHKNPSLFSGVPTYTQSPLSLLWCANLHTKTPLSSLVCQLTHKNPSLSSLVCQLTHKNPSLFSGVPTYTQSPLSLLWCANLHTKPSLSSLVCQLTHKNPSLFSGVPTYTQKPLSLFCGVPTYTQKPLSLLWCANLHTKPSLSSLVC